MKYYREEKLLRRYPILKNVPEGKRASVVRAAIMHPLLVGGLLAVAFLLGPLYLDFAFSRLGLPYGDNFLLQMTKLALVMLLPMSLIVWLLTRFVMPRNLRRVMQKRGYIQSAEDEGLD